MGNKDCLINCLFLSILSHSHLILSLLISPLPPIPTSYTIIPLSPQSLHPDMWWTRHSRPTKTVAWAASVARNRRVFRVCILLCHAGRTALYTYQEMGRCSAPRTTQRNSNPSQRNKNSRIIIHAHGFTHRHTCSSFIEAFCRSILCFCNEQEFIFVACCLLVRSAWAALLRRRGSL